MATVAAVAAVARVVVTARAQLCVCVCADAGIYYGLLYTCYVHRLLHKVRIYSIGALLVPHDVCVLGDV